MNAAEAPSNEHDVHGNEIVVLRDGREIIIRPVAPADWPALIDLVGRLSDHSRRMRFFSTRRKVADEFAMRMAMVNFRDRAAYVAAFPGEVAVRAVGRYGRTATNPTDAEVAFVVEDSLHGQGIASHLLVHLRLLALENGITTFSASVLGENREMLSLFRNAGLQATFLHAHDMVHVSMNLNAPAL